MSTRIADRSNNIRIIDNSSAVSNILILLLSLRVIFIHYVVFRK